MSFDVFRSSFVNAESVIMLGNEISEDKLGIRKIFETQNFELRKFETLQRLKIFCYKSLQ